MRIKVEYRQLILLFGILLGSACAQKTTQQPTTYDQIQTVLPQAEAEKPRLVVLLSVDQMRGSYLDRFSEFYSGGLKRLREEGMVFDNAHHEHGLTLTAPGHATISTGRYPRNHGVVENDFLNQATIRYEYSVEDPTVKNVGVEHMGMSHSPKNLKIRAIGDWLKKDNRKGQVCAVSLKDRSGILLAGQNPDQVFWFDDISSRFISSTYYGKEYPEWANQIVGREFLKEDIENGWHKKLKDDAAYERLAGPDNILQENALFIPEFPHDKKRMKGFMRPESREKNMIWNTPFGDKLALRFARELVERNQLGSDEITDMLIVGCSAADVIGHHFGPDSQEVMDYYLRLDDYLETFFDFLDKSVGRDRYLVVVTGDHGVVSMPEVASQKGIDAKRITIKEFGAIMDQFELDQQKALGLDSSLVLTASFSGLTPDYREAITKKIKPAELRRKLADALKELDFVEDAFTLEDLEVSNPNWPYQELYRRSTFPGRGHDIKLRYKENYLVAYSPFGSSHGSPYAYDSHVPLVFYGFEIPNARIDRKVATVDIAPTLARILGLSVSRDKFDGNVLLEVPVARSER